MGLLTKFVIIKWNPRNKKWYESRGYIFTKWKDEFEVKVEDLMNSSDVPVKIKCDGCGKELIGIGWLNYKIYAKEDGTYYCFKCAHNKHVKWISFKEWCYDNLSVKLADLIMLRWDDDLNVDKYGNKLTPNDITYSSDGINKKGYWFKCLDHPEHVSEQKRINGFVHGQKGNLDCNQCNKIIITHPYIIKDLVNKEDAYKYSYGTSKKLAMKCFDCGFEKKMFVFDFIKDGFGCPRCSDGKSYPEKFVFNMLEQITKLNKIKEFETEKRFDWLIYEFRDELRRGKLDGYFEVNSKAYVIEMDGGFHEKDNKMSGQTKEESKFIDDEKDRLCEEHGIEVIRIRSVKSELEHIKNNIIQSILPKILNFKESDIDWLKCHEAGVRNLVKVICNMWREGTIDTLEISNKVKIGRNTAVRYLNQGAELGWCNYNGREESKKNYMSHAKKISVKVICITTEEIFDSQIEGGLRYNIDANCISKCCRKIQKSAGKHPITNDPLKWQYYSEYIKSNPLPTAI